MKFSTFKFFMKLARLSLCPPLILSISMQASALSSKSKSFNVSSQQAEEKNKFIKNLIKKMTIEEKVGQLNLMSAGLDTTGPVFDPNFEAEIPKGRITGILNAYTPSFTRHLQDLALKSRLKIPLLLGYDVIHGHRTIFPIPLGESCSWDLDLIKKTARISAHEAAADGVNWVYGPMVDISRDPRWGRVAEGAGEDPFLGSAIARARVQGFQGDKPDLTNPELVLATVKHFAFYGAPTGGRDYNGADLGDQEKYSTYLPPYAAAIEAGVGSVMTSFNEINRIPVTANKSITVDLLRKRLHFKGPTVTDYTAIHELTSIGHSIAEDDRAAAILAMNAQIDIDMQDQAYIKYLPEVITKKIKIKRTYEDKEVEIGVTMNQLDEAVARVLGVKWDLGLFKDPYRGVSQERANQVLSKGTAKNQEALDTALKIAQKSIVLLKNKTQSDGNKILPLKAGSKVALIGPLADNKYDLLGSWKAAGDYNEAVSLLEGLKKKTYYQSLHSLTLDYAKGANITEDLSILRKLNAHEGNITQDSLSPEVLLQNAVELAKNSDVIVAAVGESRAMTGEAASLGIINLEDNQQRLLEALKETGKPLVIVLMNGRPLAIEWARDNADAIIEAWLLGTRAGDAIADVLVGDYNPSGKLTMTFPLQGHIPNGFYSGTNSGRPMDPKKDPEKTVYTGKYIDIPNDAVFPFGYGLSYTTFEYSDITLSSSKMKKSDKLTAKITVKNTGIYRGDEIVQLYLRDIIASPTRPVQELKGFQKIHLGPNESKEVEFTLTNSDLEFYSEKLHKRSQPGEFELIISSSSKLPTEPKAYWESLEEAETKTRKKAIFELVN